MRDAESRIAEFTYRGGLARAGATYAAALVLALVLIFPASATAAISHTFTSSFEPTGIPSPTAVAVDEATGGVYVLNKGTGTIGKFDSSGNPVDFSALGVNTIAAPCGSSCNQIAVDNSVGPNAGVLYVSSNESTIAQHMVRVFLPSGLPADPVESATEKSSTSLRYCGVSTDPAGHLYVAHNNGLEPSQYSPFPPSSAFVDRFKPGQWLRGEDPDTQTWPITGVMFGQDQDGNGNGASCRSASDSTGAIYFSQYAETSGLFTRRPVFKSPGTFFNFLPGPAQTPIDDSTYFAVDFSNDDFYSNRENEIARFDSEGTLQETFGEGSIANSYGVAVHSDSGEVYATDSVAGTVSVFEAVTTPDVIASAVAGRSTAALSGHVDPTGAGGVTGCKFEYGTSTEYSLVTQCTPDAAGVPFNGPQDVTAGLTGLIPETTYHYRLVATNSNGTSRGTDRTFTTHHVDDVMTDAPTAITQTTATLNGSFKGDGSASSYYFEWGPTEAYGNQTEDPPGESVGSPTGEVEVSAPIAGLAIYGPESAAYHYRLVVTNSSGTTFGPDRSFFTAPPDLPQISETAFSGVTPTTAIVSARVNPGNGDTAYLFEYGPSSSYGSATPIGAPISGDDTEHPITSHLSGLAQGTTYHFRAVAINFGGTTHGPDLTFTTPDAPRIDATTVSAVSQSSARLGALVAANASSTAVRFEYGTTTAYGQSSAPIAIGSELLGREAGADLAGLTPDTTYHFRTIATNPIGTTAGPDQMFTTEARLAEGPATSAPVKCGKRFVKRKGRCVKRKRSARNRTGNRPGKARSR